MHNTPEDIMNMTPRPYNERSVHNLLYLKAALEQQDVLVPTDLLAALSAKGVVV
jgi:hypothetical protein